MVEITFIPGDGIGPEIMSVMRDCVDATGVEIVWDERLAGEAAVKEFGTPLPESTLQSIRKNKVGIKGPLTTPVGSGYRSINVALRKKLDLYAGIRPCKFYDGVVSSFDGVDLVVFRENLEGLYSGIEFEKGKVETKKMIKQVSSLNGALIRGDSALVVRNISASNSRRIVTAAFDFAEAHGRRKVTAVHKANILKFTDGLFLSTARRVAKKYPGIEFDDVIVDNACLQLVKNPDRFDVLVLPNLYGDIVSDLCAGLVGGLGVAPSANVGDKYALFEAAHGSAPKYAGLDKVNPASIILASVMLLRHVGKVKAASKLESAVASVISRGRKVTYDLLPKGKRGKAVGTKAFGKAVIEVL